VQQQEAYTARCYHQPCDEYRADFDLTGAVQLSEAVLSYAMQIANGGEMPAWSPGAEFRRPSR
jgi:hypothetical protein